MSIDSWSFSRLMDFEKCKFYAYLKHDRKIPEPQRPLRPGETELANDRGSRIHDAAEGFVRGLVPLTPELSTFAPEFNKLRELFKLGVVQLEQEWGFRDDWTPMSNWYGEWDSLGTTPPDGEPAMKPVDVLPKYPKRGEVVNHRGEYKEWVPTWHRSKLDAFVMPNPHQAFVIDYKTGKKVGNEVKHGQQTDSYAVDAVSKYPELEEINVELWYPDKDDIMMRTYSRQRVIAIKPSFDKRGKALTRAKTFEPNPNKFTCMYCQYGPWNGGQCAVGVR